MKNSKKYVAAVTFMMLVSVNVLSANENDAEILPKSYLEKVDWATVDSSELVKSLNDVDSEYALAEESRILKRRDFMVGDAKNSLIFLEKDGDHKYPYLLMSFSTEVESCTNARAKLEKVLGKVNNTYNYSKESSPDGSFDEILSSWDIGSTRVRHECVKIVHKETTLIGLSKIIYSHNSTQKTLKAPVWIRCTEKLLITVNRETSEGKDRPDRIIILDENKGEGGRVLFGGMIRPNGSGANSKMAYYDLGDAADGRVEINRMTGSLHGIFNMKNTTLPTEVEFNGECRKIDPNQPAF